jgi:hypothetical protein
MNDVEAQEAAALIKRLAAMFNADPKTLVRSWAGVLFSEKQARALLVALGE